jgi:hypothetical protein
LIIHSPICRVKLIKNDWNSFGKHSFYVKMFIPLPVIVLTIYPHGMFCAPTNEYMRDCWGILYSHLHSELVYWTKIGHVNWQNSLVYQQKYIVWIEH